MITHPAYQTAHGIICSGNGRRRRTVPLVAFCQSARSCTWWASPVRGMKAVYRSLAGSGTTRSPRSLSPRESIGC